MGSQMTWNYEKQMGVGYLWGNASDHPQIATKTRRIRKK